MEDMRLYEPSNQYEDIYQVTENMNRVLPDDPTATSIEVIAGKVVKFMLTEKGSDAFEPEYGSISMHYQQMSPSFLPQFKREVAMDVENCYRFIKKAEAANNVEGELLAKINVLKIVYDALRTPWRVDVYIEIITTYGKHAVVSITPRTER